MKYTYISNWKMNLSYHDSIAFCNNNKNELTQLASEHTIVLCPTLVALAPITAVLKNSNVSIGAQNCSEYASGSYTGETSAQSLAEIGITHCIIGHRERRNYFEETTDTIIKKVHLLLQNNIQPIICIGETKEDFENAATLTILTEQLKPILESLHQTNKPIMFAYEPAWSIGTGITPENSYLEEVFAWIKKMLHFYKPDNITQLFYGGSVNEKNITQLKKVPNINGFLIGGASTDFATFKKIVTT
jgi:triosephosphate isomerase (TIM)